MGRFVSRWPGYFGPPETRWTVDQESLMACIDDWRRSGRPYVGEDRTIEPGSFLPLGRLDRFDWRYPCGPILDCHLPRPGHGEEAHARIRELYARLGLAGESEWMTDYRRRFLAADRPAPPRSEARR
jgi:hypothetical protein